MTAQELRIGNLVLDEHREIIVVSQIFSYNEGHIRCADDNAHDFEEITPIPLTEEWLLKFGFFRKGLCFCKYCFDIELQMDSWNFSLSDSNYAFEMKYVHQLQNLYYALTGKELTQ